MSVELNGLNGWYWVEWRGTLEPELFREGRMQDHDGDWIMPAPTRKIGPRIPEPKELKATELELAKLRNRVDDLDQTLAETREERDRLRAEVERLTKDRDDAMIAHRWFAAQFGSHYNGRDFSVKCSMADNAMDQLRGEIKRLRPKADVVNAKWMFFTDGSDIWVMPSRGNGTYFSSKSKLFWVSICQLSDFSDPCYTELTAHDAYARLADWPEGQRKFRELTGYEPPTCKESLPVQPEERVRCYRNCSGGFFWAATDGEPVIYFSRHDIINTSSYQESTIKGRFDVARFPLAEALEIVRDRPKQLKKLREMAGIADSVRCYRSNSGGVWVYGVQHNTYFCSHGGWITATAQSEQTTIKNGARCILSEARALLADRPKSLAEFDRIVGWDEGREHLARLLAIPCKEMRG